MLRRCAKTRSWEKKWQREKPQQVLRPTSNPSSTIPTLKNTLVPPPQLSPMSHLSPIRHTPPYYYETTTACNATPRQGEVQMGHWGWKKFAKLIQREKFSYPLFPKKNVFASFQMRKKSNWQVAVGLGFCKYFFFCYIQYDTSSKSIDCSVPFLYVSSPCTYMDVIFC